MRRIGLSLVFFLLASLGAFAQSANGGASANRGATPSTQPPSVNQGELNHDRRDLHQDRRDRRDVRYDHRDLRHDRRDIRHDRRDIHRDKQAK